MPFFVSIKILKSEIFGFSNGGVSDAEIGVEDLLNDRIATPNFGPSLEKDMMKELNKVWSYSMSHTI